MTHLECAGRVPIYRDGDGALDWFAQRQQYLITGARFVICDSQTESGP